MANNLDTLYPVTLLIPLRVIIAAAKRGEVTSEPCADTGTAYDAAYDLQMVEGFTVEDFDSRLDDAVIAELIKAHIEKDNH